MKTPLVTLVVAGAALTGLSIASAQQFGQVRVLSAVGEPLRAEVDLNDIPAAGQGVRVGVSSLAIPGTASGGLQGMVAKLSVNAGGQGKVLLTSRTPVAEPMVQVVLELTTPEGQLMREVSLLVNPRGMGQPPQVTRLASVASDGAPLAPDAPVAAADAPDAILNGAATAPVRTASADKATRPGVSPALRARALASLADKPTRSERRLARGQVVASNELKALRVRQGDTLSGLARQVQGRVQGVSLDQILVGLYRNNQRAFMGENMNRLRSGVVLRVPAAQRLRGIDAGEATDMVLAHSTDFGHYKTMLASHAPKIQVAQGAAQSQKGDVLPLPARVNDESSAATAKLPDQLKLSSAASVQDKSLQKMSQEAQRKDAAEQMAEAQNNLQDLKALASAAATVAAPAAAEAAPAAATTAPAPVAAAAVPDSGMISAAVAAPAPAAAPASASVSAPEPVVPPQAAAAGSSSARSWLRPVLGGALGLLVGLTVLWGWRRWRKPAEYAAFENSRQGSEDGLLSHEGGQVVDTDSRFGTLTTVGGVGGASVLPVAKGLIDPADVGASSDGVDPLQEARVYVAYGRVEEAREILEEAIAMSPNDPALRRLLLDVLAQGENKVAFATHAQWMLEHTGGEGEDWATVQAMGREMDPAHWMYQVKPEVADPPSSHVAEKAEKHDARDTPRSLLVGAGVVVAAAAASSQTPAEPQSDTEEASLTDAASALFTDDEAPALNGDSLPTTEVLEPVTATLDNTLSEQSAWSEDDAEGIAGVVSHTPTTVEGHLYDIEGLTLSPMETPEGGPQPEAKPSPTPGETAADRKTR